MNDEIKKDIRYLNNNKINFIVPDYQRGYRWTEDDVRKFIDDILKQKHEEKETSYYIQPIVYRKDGEKYILIDGQQRLTTIYIILKVLEHNNVENCKVQYKIEYDTRTKSKEYLENLYNDAEFDKFDTIDIFHMSLAKHAVEEKIENIDKERLMKRILDAKFIFYEIEPQEEAEFFKRLNMDKIPLTNGELVKALLLNRSYEEERTEQLKWAILWENMEKSLHEDDFFCMLTKDTDKYLGTRIDLILEIIAEKIISENPTIKYNTNSKYRLFEIFEQYEEIVGIKGIWEQIRECYRNLRTWYENNEIYHLVGYIINFEGKKLRELLDLYNNEKEVKNKQQFIAKLYEIIKEMNKRINIEIKSDNRTEKVEMDKKENVRTICKTIDLDSNKEAIRRILLLFNILTMISTNNEGNTDDGIKELRRFSFGCYNKQKWDIEHIHALNEENAKANANEKDIEKLKEVLGERFKKEISEIENEVYNRKDKNNKNMFKEIFDRIYYASLGTNKDIEMTDLKNINSLRNYTLLDKKTNSTYKDNVFIIKRDYILKNDQKGIFIPICTRNLFLKYYTKGENQIACWSNQDGEDYLNEMIKKIEDSPIYFNKESNQIKENE